MRQLFAQMDDLGPQVESAFFHQTADVMAPLLLGRIFLRQYKGKVLGGRIIETEAYTEDDPASHTFRGMTQRNRSMFAQPGTLYVYRSYGIHWCVNIKCGRAGRGEGVLIRAIQPLYGLEAMRKLRGFAAGRTDRDLCNGPGKLTQALAIDKSFDGQLINSREVLLLNPTVSEGPEAAVVTGPRVGITRGLDLMWRFRLSENAGIGPSL